MLPIVRGEHGALDLYWLMSSPGVVRTHRSPWQSFLQTLDLPRIYLILVLGPTALLFLLTGAIP